MRKGGSGLVVHWASELLYPQPTPTSNTCFYIIAEKIPRWWQRRRKKSGISNNLAMVVVVVVFCFLFFVFVFCFLGTALPFAGRYRLSVILYHSGRPKGVSHASCACLLMFGSPPPLPSLTCAQVLVYPRVLQYKGPFPTLPASITLTPAPPRMASTCGPVLCWS